MNVVSKQITTPGLAFEAYLAAAHRLPRASHPRAACTVTGLVEAAERFDTVLLDAYGVLNVGEAAIPGAAEAVAALRLAGRRVMVVSNSAAYPKTAMLARFARMGLNFAPDEVTTSREALLARLAAMPDRLWSAMIGEDRTEFTEAIPLRDDADAYDRAEGFLLVGADGWSERRQAMLEASLRRDPRSVLVGNPDIVAPRETGLSLEPGYYAHRLADAGLVEPEFLGKPFGGIFDLAATRLGCGLDPARVLMVGDTLHTDILGGAAAGFSTALVTGREPDARERARRAMAASGIVPDYVMEAP